MIFDNLIEQKLITKGTWIGLKNGNRPVVTRLWVQTITCDNKLVAVDHNNNQTVVLDPQMIVEIDGMNLERFCQQADLTCEGKKITGIKRRGRKPKNRSQ